MLLIKISRAKLQNLDENKLDQIAKDLVDDDDDDDNKNSKKQRQAKARLQKRLAAEKKAQFGKKKQQRTDDVDMDVDEGVDEDAFATFAKGSRERQKKR